MSYVEIQPGAELHPWIECYWTRAERIGLETQRILPDGCADAIFDLGAARAFAVGTMTRPLMIESGTPEYLGVRFRPGRAAHFLRCSLSAITDGRHEMSAWSGIAERLAESPGPANRITILEETLWKRVAGAQADSRLDAAVAGILRSHGAASIDDIAANANLSRQHLGRLFAHHVGVSPKTFARITRFRRAVDLGRQSEASWSHLAAELGYADQSHLIADFREFAGSTPVPFFQSRPRG